jgi:hypothetical protein
VYLTKFPATGDAFIARYLAERGITSAREFEHDDQDDLAITLIGILHPTKKRARK